MGHTHLSVRIEPGMKLISASTSTLIAILSSSVVGRALSSSASRKKTSQSLWFGDLEFNTHPHARKCRNYWMGVRMGWGINWTHSLIPNACKERPSPKYFYWKPLILGQTGHRLQTGAVENSFWQRSYYPIPKSMGSHGPNSADKTIN